MMSKQKSPMMMMSKLSLSIRVELVADRKWVLGNGGNHALSTQLTNKEGQDNHALSSQHCSPIKRMTMADNNGHDTEGEQGKIDM